MLHYFEISQYEDGYNFPTSYAFDTLEEAIAFAEEHGVRLVCEIGGEWCDWEKCELCNLWVPSVELDEDGKCDLCRAGLRKLL